MDNAPFYYFVDIMPRARHERNFCLADPVVGYTYPPTYRKFGQPHYFFSCSMLKSNPKIRKGKGGRVVSCNLG